MSIVSIIIPAYNTEKYIAKAIASALSQTLSDIEVIVVDDCSTDNTVEVVRSFFDPRLKLLLNPNNLGAGRARNNAIQVASGKWIAVLDSDDWYAPQRLEKLVAIAEAKNADFIADDSYLIEDGNSSPWGTIISKSGRQIPSVQQFLAAEFILSDIENKDGLRLGFSKPLFRRDFLVKHQIKYKSIKVSQDFWFDMDCFLHGARFFLVPEPYYYYRSRLGSLVSSNKIERLQEECQAINDFMQHQDYLNDNPQVLNALKLKLRETKKWLDYYLLVEPLKRGQILSVLKTIYSNPLVLKYLTLHVPKLIERRLEFWSEHNKINYQRKIFRT